MKASTKRQMQLQPHELSGVEGDIDWGDMMNQLGGNEGGESSSANVDERNSGEID